MFDTKMKTSTKTLTTYTPSCLQTQHREAAVKRSFLINDVTEFTGNLKPMCEWCFSGKKTERCYLCEQHIFEFTGKVVPVILWQFTGIIV